MKENMKKRLGALFMAFIMVLSMVVVPSVKTEAASKKYVKSLKLSKGTVSVEEGKKVAVNATVAVKGSAKKNVTVKSSNTKVVKVKVGSPTKKGISAITITGVKKGSATITVKTKDKDKKKKALSKKIKVTVKAKGSDTNKDDNDTPTDDKNNNTDTNNNTNNETNNQNNNNDTENKNDSGSTTDGGGSSGGDSGGSGSGGSGGTESGGGEKEDNLNPNYNGVYVNGYLVNSTRPFSEFDYSVEYTTVKKNVEFKINSSQITKAQLIEMGYTISDDGTTATKTNTLAKATYTFYKLPKTLDEIKKISLDSNELTRDGVTLDYGMFGPMVANILALHTYEYTSPLDMNNPVIPMLEYINGATSIGNSTKQNIVGNITRNPEVKNCYFVGASCYNNYKPEEPFKITMEEGPYYIPAKDSKPERHMVFVNFDGADNDRYIDVYKASDDKWYSFEDQVYHLTASVTPVVEELVPPEEGEYTEIPYTVSHGTVNKEVRFKINKSVISPEELKNQGYTISEDGNEASKDNILATATYTFNSLPTDLKEIKGFLHDSDKKDDDYEGLDYDMFKPLVASILAFHTFNPMPGTPLDMNNQVIDMMDYINGGFGIANCEKQNIVEKLTYNANLNNCYFGGASPLNDYTPDTPYTITVEEGPYYIPERTSINGYEPERRMVFVHFDGADSDRYIDVYKGTDDKWYCYNDSFRHLYASVKVPFSLDEPEEACATKFDNYRVEYGTEEKEVNFDIATDRVSAEELRNLGYTISDDGKTASRVDTLAKATFTFDSLPESLDEIKGFSLESDIKTINGVTLDYGMLRPMVAAVLAYHTFDSSKGDYSTNPIVKMHDYINGGYDISTVDKQNLITQLNSNPDIKNCYFDGASPQNGYDIGTAPFSITVYEGPYYIPQKESTPERHMVFIHTEGADSDRYIDVYKDYRTNNWYSYNDNFKHLYTSIKASEK